MDKIFDDSCHGWVAIDEVPEDYDWIAFASCKDTLVSCGFSFLFFSRGRREKVP